MDTYTIKETEVKAIQLKSDNIEEVKEILRSISQDFVYVVENEDNSVLIDVDENLAEGYLGDYLLKKDKKVYIIPRRAFKEIYVGKPTTLCWETYKIRN